MHSFLWLYSQEKSGSCKCVLWLIFFVIFAKKSRVQKINSVSFSHVVVVMGHRGNGIENAWNRKIKILSNIYEGAFCKNSQKRKAVHYFCKKLHLGCLKRF